eukprot:gene11500-17700_t
MAEAEVLIKEKGAPEDVEASLSMSLSSQTLAPFRNATSELYRLQLVHWRNEAGSPELLAYWDGADSVRELLEALEGRVVSDEDLGCSLPFGAEALFKCERERLKFMLSEYLRIRLAKVESYTAWLLETPERRELLSSPELQFAQRFHELQRQLYSSIDETIAGLPRELIEHDRTLSVRHPNTQSHDLLPVLNTDFVKRATAAIPVTPLAKMVSQKNKKQSHVAKLKAALQAPVEDLEKVMKPFTSMVSTEQQKDVVKDERLLKAWVARMQEELDAGKLDAVAALVKPCAMQVYRSFEDEVKVVKSSGLVGFLVAAIQKLAIEGPKQSHTLTSVLDIAETINEELQLRSELFLNVAEQLITLGTDPAQTIDNRRTCLSMIKSGVYGSDDHRNHFTTEMLATLAKYCTEADDFFCQANIVGTMGKLLLKKKETAVKAMTDVWGAKWCNRLRDLIQEDPGSSQNFVLEFNAADLNPNVKSIGCHELMIGAFKLAAGEPSQFLVHFSPAAICFSLPVPDSDGE